MTSASSTSQASTPRWMWIGFGGLALVVVGVLVFAGIALSTSSEPADSGSSPAPAPSPAETTYMAIVTNQGGLIADQPAMVKLGRDACQSLGFGTGSADDNRQLAVAQFVLSHNSLSMKQADAIISAASGSGLCKS